MAIRERLSPLVVRCSHPAALFFRAARHTLFPLGLDKKTASGKGSIKWRKRTRGDEEEEEEEGRGREEKDSRQPIPAQSL